MASASSTYLHSTPTPPTKARSISAFDLRRWLQDGTEIALLDVREPGEYGEGHPFLAVPLPYSRLELDIHRLVPRTATRVVLLDQGDGSQLGERAASQLVRLGYSGVHLLQGGVSAWTTTGAALFKGVNLPSKTFGEKIELAFGVPHISATALHERQQAGEPLVLLDGRTLEEHRKMTIPGAIPVPNGELALRWRSAVPNDTVPVVVHCAGRTRSIVGAQILRDLGIPNPVLALENGTQGWALAGLELERGSTRTLPPATDGQLRDAARSDAGRAAANEGVPVLSAREAQAWVDDPGRSTFVLDVRTAAEFAAGSLVGAMHAPGGQLLQATDQFIGVRHSRVLLVDGDEGVRAPLVALWLQRLGFEAAVLEAGGQAHLRLPAPVSFQLAERFQALPEKTWAEASPAVLIDLRSSHAYRGGHARGARWSIRPRLVADVERATTGDRRQPLWIVFDDPHTAALAASDLGEAGWTEVRGISAVQASSWPQDETPHSPTDAEAIDYLFFVHDRHDGNLDAARRYLEWETALLAQCTADELAVFRLPRT